MSRDGITVRIDSPARIAGWSVDGFGHFRDHDVVGLPRGLTVVYGENEAGKSTLLAFLRGVLFGFPDGRSREPRYEPQRGGRHGGRVFIEAEGGRWIIERQAGSRRPPTVTGPAGPAGEDALRRLLGGADATLFRNVFAFGLQELQGLRSLSDDAVRSRIFAAGLVGAGRSAREVVRALGAEADGLFVSTRAYSKQIPALQRQLAEAEAGLRSAREALAAHAGLLARETAARADIATLRTRLDERAAEEASARTLLELWPVWTARSDALAELEPLDAIDVFPADGAARLERLLAAQRSAAERAADAFARWRERCAERRALIRTLDPRLRAVASDASRCHARIELHRAHLREATRAATALTGAEAQLADKLRDLGPAWDGQRVAAFDTSLPLQAGIRGFEERLRAADAAVHDAARDAAAADQAATDAARVRDGVRARVAALGSADAEQIDADEVVLGRLRASLADLRATTARRETTELLAADRTRRLAEGGAAAGAVPAWTRIAQGAFAIAVTLAVGAALLLWSGATAGAAGVALCAVTFAAAAAGARSSGRAAAAAAVRAAAAQASRRAELEAELAATRAELDALVVAEAGLRLAVDRDAQALGLPRPVEASAVEARARTLQAARDAAARRARAESDARAADETADRAASAAARMQAILARARADAASVSAEWLTWKRTAGLPASLAPAAALDFVRELQEARTRLRACDELRQRLATVRTAIEQWECDVRGLLRRAGSVPPAERDALVTSFQGLHTRCEADAAARRRAGELRREHRRTREELRGARAARDGAGRDLAQLVEEGGAADVGEFRNRLAAFERRSALLGRVRELERQITARIGADAAAAGIRAELATGRVHDWQERRDTSAHARQQLTAGWEAKVRAQQDLKNEREALERSADVPRLEAEAATLRAEIAAAARRWTVLTVAKSLVEQTLESYVRERQPGVLRMAGRRFEQVTGGRYEAVLQDGDGESFVAVDASGRTRAPDQLSRGTAEQLYLALRLALAEEFAGHGSALPLVMDDVLVNFDGRRAHAAAATLADVSRRHQVLVFTCHRSTVRLLRRHGAAVLALHTEHGPAGAAAAVVTG